MGNSVLAAVAAFLAPFRAAAATAYVQLVVATYDEDLSWIEPTLRTVSKGIPIKKLMLVIEMALATGKALDPARFAATLQETGLLA